MADNIHLKTLEGIDAPIRAAIINHHHPVVNREGPCRHGIQDLGYRGHRQISAGNGITCTRINKLHEGRPHILDAIANKDIDLIINTPVGRESVYDDSYIRKAAIGHKIAYYTTTPAGRAAARGIRAAREGKLSVRSLQSYHSKDQNLP